MKRNLLPPSPAGLARDLAALTKLRVNLLVVATAFVGFALNATPAEHWRLLLATLGGTGLIAASAAVANQVRERQFDCLMERTRNRPLAAGRWSPQVGIAICVALLLAGSLWLGLSVNRRALGFALLAFGVYAGLYTPLKRVGPGCTPVGAVSGALPVLTGWAATDAPLSFLTVIAFALLFVWQIPHFLAIAVWRRTDYERAGYRVLPTPDAEGRRTARWALVSVVALIAVSLLPLGRGDVHWWYGPATAALGAGLLLPTWKFWRSRTDLAARRLFEMTLIYLPAAYAFMLLATVPPV